MGVGMGVAVAAGPAPVSAVLAVGVGVAESPQAANRTSTTDATMKDRPNCLRVLMASPNTLDLRSNLAPSPSEPVSVLTVIDHISDVRW